MTIHRKSKNFRVVEKRGRSYIRCTDRNAIPRGRRIRRSDVNYLIRETGNNFDAACVLDFGVGVFAK